MMSLNQTAHPAGMQKSQRVMDYLNLLDCDASARSAHASSPSNAMSKFGLDNAQQTAFLSGDKVLIANLAGIDKASYHLVNATNACDNACNNG